MSLTRRELLCGTAATIAASRIVYAEPTTSQPQTTNAQLKLSLAAYSFNSLLPRSDHKGTMTLFDVADVCVQCRLGAIEPTAYYFESEAPDYLCALKAKAFRHGLDISGTAIGNNFCLPPGHERDEQLRYTTRWIDHAVLLGAPCIRVFAGKPSATPDHDFAWTVENMKQACAYAGEHGVFLAIENHGYLTGSADALLRLLDAVNSDWFAINLDTGNFLDTPYDNIAKAAPYAVTSQIKARLRTDDGKDWRDADFARLMRIFAGANYRGYVALEYEGNEDPHRAVPHYLDKLRAAMTKANLCECG